jgi:hypothetical protein
MKFDRDHRLAGKGEAVSRAGFSKLVPTDGG